MFQKKIKRHKTPFGIIIHKRGPTGTNLLITNNGRQLGWRYGEKLGSLLRSVRINREDYVTFGPKLHPELIGLGEHAKLFRVFPKEERQFVEAKPASLQHLPSVVLKVYRQSVSQKDKPDGFTQFFANSFVYNYLKKLTAKGYHVRPLRTYFVSEMLLARKFINALTLGEIYRTLHDIRLESGRLSNAFEDPQVYSFLKRLETNRKEIDLLDSNIKADVEQGAKIGFNTGFKIVPDFSHMENVFFLGRTRKGEPTVSIIDQGKEKIKGLGNLIRKGKLFPQK
jgi:hypothetical protein